MNRYLYLHLLNRDGEIISLCGYAPCMEEEECGCQCSSQILKHNNKSSESSAVSLQLYRGFYHDRYSDIAKVPFFLFLYKQNSYVQSSSTLLCFVF